MKLHLLDGTYELYRAFFAVPATSGRGGLPINALQGITATTLALLRQPDVTHLGAAFDHVIESFRNEMFAGYKTGEGVPEELAAQFHPAERVLRALGVAVWPMVEFEADDALGTAAERWADQVDQVVICTPDKDLAQCVRGDRVVCLDRRKGAVIDADGVRDKFGVSPASIPDWLGLVGDSADGIPGIPAWGAKSAAAVLSRYGHLEQIPDDPAAWDIKVRGAKRLADNLHSRREEAALYRDLATLRTDAPLPHTLEDLRWRGADRDAWMEICDELGLSQRTRELPHRWR